MPLIARYNVLKLLLGLLGSLGFVIAGAWLMTIPGVETIFWGAISIIFFGFCGIFYLRCFIDRREILVVDEYGIFDRRTLSTAIPWSSIEDIREMEMYRQILFGVTVSEPARFFGASLFKRSISALNKSLGADVFLSAHGLSTNTDKLRAALKEGCTLARVPETA